MNNIGTTHSTFILLLQSIKILLQTIIYIPAAPQSALRLMETFFLLEAVWGGRQRHSRPKVPQQFATRTAIDESLKINRAATCLGLLIPHSWWGNGHGEPLATQLFTSLHTDVSYLSSGCESSGIPSAELCFSVSPGWWLFLCWDGQSVSVPARHHLGFGAWVHWLSF